MRYKETWMATVEPEYFAQHSKELFSIKATLNKEPDRELLVNLRRNTHRQTARNLAKALLEWAGEED